MLKEVYIFWSEGICGVFWHCELDLCSIVWFGVSVGGFLCSCWFGMLELVEHIGYVPWHGHVDAAFVILAVKGQAHVDISGTVVGDLI